VQGGSNRELRLVYVFALLDQELDLSDITGLDRIVKRASGC